MELLGRLSEATGVPGHEGEVREIVRDILDEHVDEIATDHLGNVIAHRKGEGPKVAIAAHMDEIGFLVSHIEEKTGFLRIHPLGGFDVKTLISQRVVVHGEEKDLIGCIGSKPVHVLTDEEKKKLPKMKDLFVDVGLSEKVVKEIVCVGDPVTLRQDFLTYGDVVSGKALDDRCGLYVGIEAIKRATNIACDLYLVGTSQEEVGLRGARVTGHAINPDIGIALDVTIAADIPGVSDSERVTKSGDGVAIKIKDSASISHPGLVREFRRLAEERDIKYQLELLPHGGTDAGSLQIAQSGVAVITLSIPTRYVHSVVESANVGDIEAAIDLLVAFLEKADKVRVEME